MKFLFGISFFLFLTYTPVLAQDVGEKYIVEWKKFYPSKALQSGIRASIFNYEERSDETITAWLLFNESIIKELSKKAADVNPVDGRLLRVQAQREVDRWKTLMEHNNSLTLYSNLISRSVTSIFEANYLLAPEKAKLVCNRLKAMADLAAQAQNNLKHVAKKDVEKGLEALSKTLDYLKNDILEVLREKGLTTCPNLDTYLVKAIRNVESLQEFGIATLQQNAKESELVIGRSEYDRRLGLYTDSDLTSGQLEEMALEEISTVRKLMTEVSKKHLSASYPNKESPKNDLKIIELALADMEKDAPLNATDYLQFWQQLADSAVTFIKKKDIATLPKNSTLRIQTAPESAGPAARIGWVASAPPFDPNPMTTLNLPSIPESLPKQEQIEFWASFNKPFNRMIVIHELYPGHYMQLKISRETPHPVRLLFPYGIYIEGWATFTEKVLLDAGWEAGNHLTLLAHLRKRLENANRAYTSVQVHCNGWSEEKVMQFSTETALLAPQFAKSLWGRIMSSPMQLTSYYLGGAQFTKLLKFEKDRLGDNFNLKLFMDTIMKTGPIPIEEFYAIFKNTNPN